MSNLATAPFLLLLTVKSIIFMSLAKFTFLTVELFPTGLFKPAFVEGYLGNNKSLSNVITLPSISLITLYSPKGTFNELSPNNHSSPYWSSKESKQLCTNMSSPTLSPETSSNSILFVKEGTSTTIFFGSSYDPLAENESNPLSVTKTVELPEPIMLTPLGNVIGSILYSPSGKQTLSTFLKASNIASDHEFCTYSE